MKKLVRFAFILEAGLLFLKHADGLRPAVAVYEDNSCTAPARFVTMTSSLTCTPQADHSQPKCESGGKAYYISDCTNYYYRGYDDAGVIWQALRDYPYLGVEKYPSGKCSRDYLTNATMYRLDENCYSNAAGTASHRLTLGHSAVITTYNDADCTNVVSTTTVQQRAIGWTQAGNCLDDVAVFYGSTRPNVTAVVIYDDATCSSVPTQIKFSQDFMCHASSNGACEDHLVSSCTSDFSSFTAEKFGTSNPYVIIQDFPNPWCYSMEYATAYSADGSCHANVNDGGSFRATINADNTATIITYSDATCTAVTSYDNLESGVLSSSSCIQQSCTTNTYGCSKRYAVGGLGGPPSMGKKVSIAVYEDNSCTAPARFVTMTSSLTCTPQADHSQPKCESGGKAYYISDCTNYYYRGYDDAGVIWQALRDYPYLGVEKYPSGKCSRDYLTNATMYRLDENCYSNAAGTASHRLTLGHSAVITTYNDADCTNVVSTTTVQQRAIGWTQAGNCLDDVAVFYGSTRPNVTAVVIYDDATCSSVPTQIKFSQDFMCHASSNGACEDHLVSSCTSDFSSFTAEKFGTSNPYVIIQDFPNPWCYSMEYATAYSADGSCHANVNDGGSFRATINADNTATIITYLDATCTAVTSYDNLESGVLSSSSCIQQSCTTNTYGCSKRYAVGGLGGPPSMGKKVSIAVYEDNSCTAPARFVTMTSSLTCTPQADHSQPKCESGGKAYYISDCTNYYYRGYDDAGVIWQALRDYPYLGVEKYPSGKCSRDYLTNATMYRLDENCYSNAAGTASHRLTLGHSAVITTYNDADCTNVVSTTTVQQRAIGWTQAGNCLDDVAVFYGSTRPNVTAVVIYDDATCSSVPTQIKFSQDFMCHASSNGACEDHLVSSCTSDFSSFTAEKFGTSNPYVIIQDFPNPWCYSMEYATAYSADGSCHANVNDGGSFRATINADNTATIITYLDATCTVVASYDNLESGVLSSSSCIQQSCTTNTYGCSKRYAVGGLDISSTPSRRVAVSVYEDNSCNLAPIQMSITKALVCLPLSGMCDPIIAGTTGVFEVQECIDDYDSFAKARYGFSPYLIIESYGIGTNCRVQDKVRIYAGDGRCHPSAFDGNYFAVMQNADGSIVIVTYPTSSCADGGSVSVVESWNINTDNCVEGNRKYRTSETPLAKFSLSSDSALPTPTPTQGPPTWTPTPPTITFCIPPTTTPVPSWTPPSPPTQTEKEVDRLDIMFPAWLWDPTPPRVFVDDGLHRPHQSPGRLHEFPDHRRFP